MVKITDKKIRNEIISWGKAGYINRVQVKALVKKTNWYNKTPIGVSTWQGTLFGAWNFILLGIEKDGEVHT